jgi:hypothetical protein
MDIRLQIRAPTSHEKRARDFHKDFHRFAVAGEALITRQKRGKTAFLTEFVPSLPKRYYDSAARLLR